ncbi:hypothetical protein SteCoe_27727 [Stentor coeruleus]|uniref:Uncharacterized protein n=1 Tax=Stentor coeruleus TaxID=5963 RepID=A0A1R2B9U1_9CILI|nr:hypothetical protein SteCoe_27727 [Stentor coeruleus]
MGKSGSKQKEPVQAEVVDNREALSRNFGEKYNEYWNRLEAIENIPIEDSVKRPVRNSTYWKDWPMYQGFFTYTAFLLLVMRKLPFTNPYIRVSCWVIGIDIARSRALKLTRYSEDHLNELSCFPLLKRKLLKWKSLRSPDFTLEYEDWFLFNKPAYRVPIGLENNADALARYIFVSRNKFKERVVPWNGEWEQENPLVMDLNAPHTDYWLTHH